MEYSRTALDIIQDETLTYYQQLIELSKLGESTDNSIELSSEYLDALHRNVYGKGVRIFRTPCTYQYLGSNKLLIDYVS